MSEPQLPRLRRTGTPTAGDRHRLRMLAVLASPVSDASGERPPAGPPLDVWGEWERLIRAVQIRDLDSGQGVPWALARLAPPTCDDLADHLDLADPGYQVVHFGCHGLPDGLALEDGVGRERVAATAALVDALRETGVRLAVLNACESEAVARALVERAGLAAAVATRHPILDQEAAMLAERLYRGLAVGRPVGEAIGDVQQAIRQRYERDEAALPWHRGEKRPFTAAERAANLVLVGDPALTLEADHPPADSPRFVLHRTPHNDPLPLGALNDFVGRHAELHTLGRWFTDTGRLACSLSGVGGVGKTALALNAGLRAAHRFDAFAFASAKADPDFGLLQVVQAIDGALGIQLEPHESANLAGAVARRLNEHRVLLVLDNLEDLSAARAGELARTLDGVDHRNGSRVLMTLRPREKGALTDLVDPQDRHLLQTLDAPSALRLAWELAMRFALGEHAAPPRQKLGSGELERLRDLAARCWLGGGTPQQLVAWLAPLHRLAEAALRHPKLIRLAVSGVADKGWAKTFARLDKLAGKEITEALEELIGRMVDDLAEGTPDALPVLHAALVFRAGAAEALLRHVVLGRAVDDDSVEAIDFEDGPLDAALRSSLLSKAGGASIRYDLDPPVRAYLERLRPPEAGARRETELRHAEALVGVVAGWSDAIREGHASLTSPPDWVDAMAAWDRLAEQADDARARRALLDHSAVWSNVVVNNYHPRRSDWLQAALAAAQAEDGAVDEARALKDLGDVHRFNKQLDPAVDCYQRALELCRQAEEPIGEANTLEALGDVCSFRGDFAAAESRYEEALAIFRARSDQLGEANTLRALGECCKLRGDLDAAEKHLLDALAITREIVDPLGEANCLISLGGLQLLRSDLDAARARFGEALPTCRAVGDPLGEGNAFVGLAQIALLEDDPGSADELLERALAIYAGIGDRYSAAAQVGNCGWLLLQAGQADRARPFLQEAGRQFAAMGLDDYAEKHFAGGGQATD